MPKSENERNETSLEKREAVLPEGVEHTREGRQFAPPADIYETADGVTIVADMPGVGANGVDITLEKNVLTIRGNVDEEGPEGFRLAYAEYQVGDFVRNFVISDEIDRDGIEAHSKDGVLTLTLPKRGPTRKRIEVKAD
jgi:HSP20 family molecular chaperone IbpA